MAIATTSPLVGGISGALGGSVFAATKAGLVIKHRPAKIKYASSRSAEIRSLFQTALVFWKEASDDVQNAWRTYAASVLRPNRLSTPRLISGYQQFMKFHIPHMLSNTVSQGIAPPDFVNPTDFALDVNFEAGGPFEIERSTVSSQPFFSFRVYGVHVYQSNTPRVFPTLLHLGLAGPVSATLNIYNAWVAALGDPPEGTPFRVAVQTTNYNTFPSLLVAAQGTVQP